MRTLNFEGLPLVLTNDFELKYQSVRFLSRFLIYETLDVHDNLHFLLKGLKFQDSNTIKCSTCIQFVLKEILDSLCKLWPHIHFTYLFIL